MLDHTSSNRVVFDVETQKTFDEVGGYDNKEQLGISYIGVYSYSQNKMFGFLEDELPMLEKILIDEKPMLIGFNSKNFDVPVMQPYFPNIDLAALPHLDILEEINNTLGHRVKLDNVAQATLYKGKSGDGLDAIRWYRSGDLESLAKYCLMDVEVTRDVYEYGLKHGRIFYPSGGERKPIPVKWSDGSQSIADRLAEAFKKHESLEIEYFQVDELNKKEVVTLNVEILDYDGERFDAYCVQMNNKDKFQVSNVWAIHETGQVYAHQGQLF
ncbi:MAG: hypothetical protein COW24_03980 [Candidatus Kerfeldbacteria bacterium CG15_BIG_FIL_POST_REV_8_21_14_020_45_12]|uniref:YprB ribonuclease H-like domain-containing protein n=1 Tax=Candidatus Kerfeldbacteria bacterium CG15_BIG_FIL_POST_REV_8_21_14_020_45_12 TaxID=2014247 RepID=A0A2M7H3B4_9BACT|nr:MAG: hypothetical protein COW24_03980 [Candidatus Kerfeldbacteria bacterium CG15_BIG_FIL_POST_REV_8_21_14_020_45_12]PJA93845.1 MAG: hypothetical protein CO132_01125 [Candidatus Kerfeldbacteria bacterium CG_4_9_14_3_um_filter_45_8]